MKILKKAKQRNFVVSKYYHNADEISEIIENYFGFYFVEGERIETSREKKTDYSDLDVRVSDIEVKEIKTILDEYGYYTNIAVMNDGMVVFIEL